MCIVLKDLWVEICNMAEDRQISPEEKLLKVIQSGEVAKGEPTSEEKMPKAVSGESAGSSRTAAPRVQKPQSAVSKPAGAAVRPPPVTAASSPLAVQDALQPSGGTAKQPGAAAPVPKPAPSAEAARTQSVGAESRVSQKIGSAAADIGRAQGIQAPKKRHEIHGSLLAAANKALGALAAALVALTAWQIWGMVHGSSGPAGWRAASGLPAGPGNSGQVAVSNQSDFDVEQMIEAYLAHNVFKYPESAQQSLGTSGGVVVTNVSVQTSELLARLKLMGFTRGGESEAEAILWDKESSRMHIVRKGGKIMVGEKPLELVDVQREHVVLSDGKERLTIR